MKKFLFVMAAAIVCLCSLSSCTKSESAPTSLVGTTWKGENGEKDIVTWFFKSDKELVITATSGSSEDTQTVHYAYANGSMTIDEYSGLPYSIQVTETKIVFTISSGTLAATIALFRQ